MQGQRFRLLRQVAEPLAVALPQGRQCRIVRLGLVHRCGGAEAPGAGRSAQGAGEPDDDAQDAQRQAGGADPGRGLQARHRQQLPGHPADLARQVAGDAEEILRLGVEHLDAALVVQARVRRLDGIRGENVDAGLGQPEGQRHVVHGPAVADVAALPLDVVHLDEFVRQLGVVRQPGAHRPLGEGFGQQVDVPVALDGQLVAHRLPDAERVDAGRQVPARLHLHRHAQP